MNLIINTHTLKIILNFLHNIVFNAAVTYLGSGEDGFAKTYCTHFLVMFGKRYVIGIQVTKPEHLGGDFRVKEKIRIYRHKHPEYATKTG